MTTPRKTIMSHFKIPLWVLLILLAPLSNTYAQTATNTDCIPGLPCIVDKTPNDPLNPNDGPNITGPNAAKTSSDACDADFMNQIYGRAYLEAEREIVMSQIALRKPDSVMEYTCFDQHAGLAGQYAAPLFSSSVNWQSKTVSLVPGVVGALSALANGDVAGLSNLADTLNVDLNDLAQTEALLNAVTDVGLSLTNVEDALNAAEALTGLRFDSINDLSALADLDFAALSERLNMDIVNTNDLALLGGAFDSIGLNIANPADMAALQDLASSYGFDENEIDQLSLFSTLASDQGLNAVGAKNLSDMADDYGLDLTNFGNVQSVVGSLDTLGVDLNNITPEQASTLESLNNTPGIDFSLSAGWSTLSSIGDTLVTDISGVDEAINGITSSNLSITSADDLMSYTDGLMQIGVTGMNLDQIGEAASFMQQVNLPLTADGFENLTSVMTDNGLSIYDLPAASNIADTLDQPLGNVNDLQNLANIAAGAQVDEQIVTLADLDAILTLSPSIPALEGLTDDLGGLNSEELADEIANLDLAGANDFFGTAFETVSDLGDFSQVLVTLSTDIGDAAELTSLSDLFNNTPPNKILQDLSLAQALDFGDGDIDEFLDFSNTVDVLGVDSANPLEFLPTQDVLDAMRVDSLSEFTDLGEIAGAYDLEMLDIAYMNNVLEEFDLSPENLSDFASLDTLNLSTIEDALGNLSIDNLKALADLGALTNFMNTTVTGLGDALNLVHSGVADLLSGIPGLTGLDGLSDTLGGITDIDGLTNALAGDALGGIGSLAGGASLPTSVTINVFMGSDSLGNLLEQTVLASLRDYLTNNFSHSFMGGYLTGEDAVFSGNGMAAAYTCDVMNTVWFGAKCQNFATDDQFFSFETLSQFDPRMLPSVCDDAQTSITANMVDLAKNEAWQYAAFDEAIDYGGRFRFASGEPGSAACAAPVPTGVQILRKELTIDSEGNVNQGDTIDYFEFVCPNPGCNYDPADKTCKPSY